MQDADKAVPDVEMFAVRLFATDTGVRLPFIRYNMSITFTYGSRGGQFEGMGSVYGIESCKIVFLAVLGKITIKRI